MRAERRSFAHDPSSIAEARRFAAQLVIEWGHPVLADDTALLVSEVVSNAILHAESNPVVEVIELDDGIRIEVADEADALPKQAGRDVTRSSGRGLQIVESLSRAWGVRALPLGKVTWFELAT
jgi:anti-sigma regulatory factor (Ser/Thr protein kinase)